MHIRWLAFAYLALAQTLEEWLHMDGAPKIDTNHLMAYVPEPADFSPPFGLDRFSLGYAMSRFRDAVSRGNSRTQGIRERYLPNEHLDNVTDKYRLGMVYLWSLGGVPRDLERSYAYFYEAATEGADADAMFFVGVFESTGYFFTKKPNEAKAVLFYSRAAELGSIDAMLALGHRHRYGLGVLKDMTWAIEYYAHAAEAFMNWIDFGLLDAKDPYDPTAKPDSPNAFGMKLRPMNRLSGSFGAETNTGLFGKHNYGIREKPANLQVLSRGDRSSALKYLQDNLYEDKFDTLDEAFEHLFYSATEEHDPFAMLRLAKIYELGANSTDRFDWGPIARLTELAIRSIPRDNHQLRGIVFPQAASMLAARYLWGEGRVQNTTRAREWFQRGINESVKYNGIDGCVSCLPGVKLCDMLLSGNITEDQLRDYEEAVVPRGDVRIHTVDPNVGMLLSDMHLSHGELEKARRILMIAEHDSRYREPRTMLELSSLQRLYDSSVCAQIAAGIENPTNDTLEMSRALHVELDYLVRAFEMAESTLTPVHFGAFSYERGDIESAVLAYAVASEMGVSQANINLADIFDVRHSYVGARWGHLFPSLRALSEWPLPEFIVDAEKAELVDRRKLAVRYFGLAALDESVDALSKLFEYGLHYGLVSEILMEHYLTLLESSNMALGHWWRGMLLYAKKDYKRALNKFSSVLVNPDAWMPAKFSQFLTALHMLKGDDESENSADSKLSFGTVFESYRGIIVVENRDPKISARCLNELGIIAAIFLVIIVGSFYYALHYA